MRLMIQSTRLKNLFSEQLEWYRKHKHDDSLIYDEAWEQFSNIYRGDWVTFLEILDEEE